MARVQFGTAKGVKGDQGPIGPTGATGPQGYPGVTDIATASAVGLVRASDDVEVNAETGSMSIKNTVTEAASVANIVTGESHQTILGKIAAAISKVITIAGDYLKSSNIVNQASTSTTTAPSSAMMKALQTQADKSTTDIASLNSNIASLNAKIINGSDLTMDQLLAYNSFTGEPKIVGITWNSAITPDSNYAVAFVIKNLAICISFSGKIYTATNESPTWTAKNT